MTMVQQYGTKLALVATVIAGVSGDPAHAQGKKQLVCDPAGDPIAFLDCETEKAKAGSVAAKARGEAAKARGEAAVRGAKALDDKMRALIDSEGAKAVGQGDSGRLTDGREAEASAKTKRGDK